MLNILAVSAIGGVITAHLVIDAIVLSATVYGTHKYIESKKRKINKKFECKPTWLK